MAPNALTVSVTVPTLTPVKFPEAFTVAEPEPAASAYVKLPPRLVGDTDRDTVTLKELPTVSVLADVMVSDCAIVCKKIATLLDVPAEFVTRSGLLSAFKSPILIADGVVTFPEAISGVTVKEIVLVVD